MPPQPTRVLLVDDDREEFILTQNILSIIVQDRYALEWVGSYDAGLEAIKKGEHELYLIDYRLRSAKNGLDLVREARALGCQAPLILLTGLWDSAVDQEAMKAGASDYLIKGQFGPEVLERSLRYAIERGKVLRELKESERKYRSIVEGTNALLFNADSSGRIVYANETAGRLLGVAPESLKGYRWMRRVHPEDRGELLRSIKDQLASGAPSVSVEARCRAAGGRELWLGLSISAVRSGSRIESVAGVALDVTERRRLQGLYIQAEKLSAMGLLAAGMAHELNTPLMLILGSCETALDVRPSEPVKGHLETIARAGERCRRLIADMLAFSRKEEGPPKDFDLGECVAAAMALVEPQARYRSVKLVREAAAAPLPARGHRNQLEQVLVNLASNGVDAMPRGGTLTVRVKPCDDKGRPCARVEISDNGKGVPPELRPRIFEPFFTTKAPGKGTGLGLSLAQEIVVKHGGRIEYAPGPESGSVFTVLVPLRVAAEPAGAAR